MRAFEKEKQELIDRYEGKCSDLSNSSLLLPEYTNMRTLKVELRKRFVNSTGLRNLEDDADQLRYYCHGVEDTLFDIRAYAVDDFCNAVSSFRSAKLEKCKGNI